MGEQKKYDPMSPDASPNVTTTSGVRRVNRLPIFIILSIIALFLMVTVYVAQQRGTKQRVSHQHQTEIHSANSTDTSAMSAAIIGNRSRGGVIPPAVATPSLNNNLTMTGTGLISPKELLVNDPNRPPLPPRLITMNPPSNPSAEQIATDKMQQFQEAVKAKTQIAIPTDLTQPRAISSTMTTENAVQDTNSAYQAKLQQLLLNRGAGSQGSGQGSDITVNNDIQQFAGSGKTDRWQLGETIEAPASPYELRAGSVISGTLISGIKSTLPGQITGQVAENVYDTATGKYLLIPQGTRLVGTYSSNIQYGQDVILVAWQRLTFPDGKTLDIGAMPGADSEGYSGFHDQVNNHYLRVFGSALLMSGIVAGISYSQDRNNNQGLYAQPTMSGELSQALGQQLGQVTAQMIAKNLNIAPLNTIRSGYSFNITVTKDLVFSKPYKSFDY
jgi:type IV secretory pathway VirB10-like protein